MKNPTSLKLRRTRVLVFGTFDGLHEGHKDFFRQAKEHGGHLTVVVGRDSTVQRVKNKPPKISEQKRLKTVGDCELVNEAVLGNEGNDPYKIIKEINPDIICLGYDQTHFTEKLEEKIEEMGLDIKVKRLKAYKPEVYKSSIINNRPVA